VLREKLCGGLADMLVESLAPAHREKLLAWIARMRTQSSGTNCGI